MAKIIKEKYYFLSVPIILLLAFLIISIQGKYALEQRTSLQASQNGVSLSADKELASRELARARKTLKRAVPEGKYIVIDTHANILSLRTGDTVLFKASCSTGSGGELIDSSTGRRWVFNTPRGIFKINSKLVDPWWRKPDWAYIEDSLKPPAREGERFDAEMMGEYAMGFGDGYFIHGTIYERLIGVSVTHGCVRLGAEDLRYLYGKVAIGTPVYIF